LLGGRLNVLKYERPDNVYYENFGVSTLSFGFRQVMQSLVLLVVLVLQAGSILLIQYHRVKYNRYLTSEWIG